MANQKLKEKDLINFTRQFATLYKSGFPILSVITTLKNQTTHPILLNVLDGLKEDFSGGTPLFQAMAKYPKIFNQFYTNCVWAGETTGSLDKIMMGMADLLEAEYRFQRDIKTALTQPLFPIAILLLLPVILIFASPQPILNKIFFSFLFLIRRYALLALVIIFLYSFIKSRAGRIWWDETKLKMPVIGQLFFTMIIFRFLRLLEIFNRANLPIFENLSLVSQTMANSLITLQINYIRDTIRMGGKLSEAIRSARILPAMVTEAIATAEETGRLDNKMIQQLTFHYYQEVEKEIEKLGRYFQMITIILLIAVAFLIILLLRR